MTSTSWTAAPASSLGLGGFAVRPDACSAVGTALVGSALVGTAVVGAFDMVATAGAAVRVRPASTHLVPAERQPRIAPTYFALNDGTTLGIHSSRRPQS